jgi:hypothetical protein
MLCWNDFNYKSGVCTIRRADNDSPVKTRRMEQHEFTRPLPFNIVEKKEQAKVAS